jgi:hypothetical protein
MGTKRLASAMIAAAVAVTGLLLSLGGPASAGPTTVDVQVTAGSLTVSAQPSSSTLTGARFNENNPSTASGSLGTIEVKDGRGLTLPWTMTASSTNFIGQTDSGESITLSPSSPLTFAASTVSVSPSARGVGTALGGALTAAGSAVTIATGTNATLATGDVTYSWTPDLSLVVPAGTPAQTYRGTVTLTVS